MSTTVGFYLFAWVLFLLVPLMDECSGGEWLAWAMGVTVIWGFSIGVAWVIV